MTDKEALQYIANAMNRHHERCRLASSETTLRAIERLRIEADSKTDCIATICLILQEVGLLEK